MEKLHVELVLFHEELERIRKVHEQAELEQAADRKRLLSIEQQMGHIRVVHEQAELEQTVYRKSLTSIEQQMAELALLLGVKDNNPRVS